MKSIIAIVYEMLIKKLKTLLILIKLYIKLYRITNNLFFIKIFK